MAAIIGMAWLLCNHRLGARVAFYAPFMSNGPGNAYPVGMVLTDPQCYRQVREFMDGA